MNPPLSLTFGVEVECVLTFQQGLLQAYLESVDDSSRIVKKLSDQARIDFSRAPRRHWPERQRYNGWGLTGPTNYPAGEAELNFQDAFERHRQQHGCRGYGGEVLHIAQRVLPPNTQVHDSFKQKRTDFSTWHVANDTTIAGLPQEELRRALDPTGVWVPVNWDSHGIELVSRILPYNEPSFDEINLHLAALKGSAETRHRAFATEHCGLHVHVGLPTPQPSSSGQPLPTFSLSTLQHLAYILVMYEGAISSLFPTNRRDGSHASQADIKSNRESFWQEPAFKPDDFPDLDVEDSENAFGKLPPPPPDDEEVPPPISFAHARSLIFAPSQTIDGLAKLMCPTGRDYIVNFTYLPRTNGRARTVEFRQHEGCLEAVGVRWWAKFCCGLVLLADQMARQHGSEEFAGQGYKHLEWSEGVSVEDLFEGMGLEEEGRAYFRGRVVKFAVRGG